VNCIILHLIEPCPPSQLLPSVILPQDTFFYRPLHLRTHVEPDACGADNLPTAPQVGQPDGLLAGYVS